MPETQLQINADVAPDLQDVLIGNCLLAISSCVYSLLPLAPSGQKNHFLAEIWMRLLSLTSVS